MTEVAYNSGRKTAGREVTKNLKGAIDTYHQGMPLKYVADVTAAAGGSNTGDGTCTVLSAGSKNLDGDYILTFKAALEADLVDPNGATIAEIIISDGAAEAFDINGLKFTITDGATAFVADDVFTITVDDDGSYQYDAEEIEAICNVDSEKTIAAIALIPCLIRGTEFLTKGLVDGSGTLLVITDDVVRRADKEYGIILRRD